MSPRLDEQHEEQKRSIIETLMRTGELMNEFADGQDPLAGRPRITSREEFEGEMARRVSQVIVPLEATAWAYRTQVRLRTRELPFTIENVLGNIVRGQGEETIGAGLHQCLHAISMVDPGDWRFVAFRLRITSKKRRKAVENPDYEPEHIAVAKGERYYGKTKQGYDLVAVLRLVTVWADFSEAPERDPWFDRTGKTDGVMFQFVHGEGRAKKMPQVKVDEYSLARDIMRDYILATLGASGAESPDDYALALRQLGMEAPAEFLREHVSVPEPEPDAPSQSPSSTPERVYPTQEELELAWGMNAKGASWKDLAAQFGLFKGIDITGKQLKALCIEIGLGGDGGTE